MNQKMNYKAVTTMLILAVLTIGSIVFANAAAPYERPEDQVLVFDDETGIALIEEWIHFTVDSQWDREVQVEVTYLLTNINREHPEIELMFVAPYLDENDIEIFFEGESITDFTMKTAENLPENWDEKVDMEIIDPISLKVLPNRIGKTYHYGLKKEGFQFSINIPEGQTKTLKMNYNSRSGYYSYDDVIKDIRMQLYYMTPAKFWEGNTRVNIMIDFPTAEYALYANFPLEKQSETHYEMTFDELPKEEFYFNYLSEEGLVFGTNDRKTHNLIVWAILGIVLVSGWVVSKRNKWAGRVMLLGLLPVLFLFRPTYGTVFMLVYFGPVIVGIFIITFIISLLLKKKKTTIE